MKAKLLVPLFLATLLAVPAAADATFPGKPGRIAYSAELPGEDQSETACNPACPPPPLTDRGFDIFTVNPDGSDLRRLTQNGAEPDDERDPAWSPDGSLLAFSALYPYRQGEFGPYPARPESRLEMMAPDGSGRRAILDGSGARGPLFSAAGDRLFFSWSAVDLLQSGVSSVKLDGSDERAENPRAYDSLGPGISPDGRFRVTTEGPDADLFISRANGSGKRQLTRTPGAYEFDASFAPDGSAVAFVRSSMAFPPNGSVHVVDLRTGAETSISPVTGLAFSVDWGPIPVRCGGRRATIVGTERADVLKGTPGRDVIAGLGGKDTLKGKKGRDILCGGPGRDKLVGGKGRDRLIGGPGRDAQKQ